MIDDEIPEGHIVCADLDADTSVWWTGNDHVFVGCAVLLSVADDGVCRSRPAGGKLTCVVLLGEDFEGLSGLVEESSGEAGLE